MNNSAFLSNSDRLRLKVHSSCAHAIRLLAKLIMAKSVAKMIVVACLIWALMADHCTGQAQAPAQGMAPIARKAPMAKFPANPRPLMVRIKDITSIEGLVGYKVEGIGLVTGLNKTGGTNPITRKLYSSYIEKLGTELTPEERLLVPTNTQIITENVSAVSVTAELLPFAEKGARLDVSVSALDNSSSLYGGELRPTVLIGLDGQEYAIAQGKLVVGGFKVQGNAASISKNHPTKGSIAGGAILYRPNVQSPVGANGVIRIHLRNGDYTTSSRVEEAINQTFPNTAKAMNLSVIEVRIPKEHMNAIPNFIGKVNSIRVIPDSVATVIIDQSSGTILVGSNVKVDEVAITHANIHVSTSEGARVSQPNPLSQGETVVIPETDITVEEDGLPLAVMPQSASVGELVNALNAIGATPADLASILQRLHRMGALHADLRIE